MQLYLVENGGSLGANTEVFGCKYSNILVQIQWLFGNVQRYVGTNSRLNGILSKYCGYIGNNIV